MRKFLILISIVAASMFSTALGAVGDVTTIVNQTFGKDTKLTNTAAYTWGSEIEGMITANGVYMTNASNKANNYENRNFITFENAVGNESHQVGISYEVYNAKDKGQDNTYYTINYFNTDGNFIFGIQEASGGWGYTGNVITANADGTTTTVALPAAHIKKGGGSVVNVTVDFSGETAIIEIDGNSYDAYTTSVGIKAVKLSVTGENGYDRDMYIKNYVLKTTEVTPAQRAEYSLNYVVDGQSVKTTKKSGVVGSKISLTPNDTEDFFNEDKTDKYIYVSNNSEGQTVAADGTTVVTLTYRKADTWNYTVKNNVNSDVKTQECIEGESATITYSRYILTADGSIWEKDPCGGDKKLEYNYIFTPGSDNSVVTLDYKEQAHDGIYFIEAENMDGMTPSTANNANIRCSDSAGAYPTEAGPVEVTKLAPGKYKVEIAFMGGKQGDTDVTFTVKEGENVVLEGITNGSWTNPVSKEFVLTTETAITIEGGSASKPLDYILITGEEGNFAEAEYTLQYVLKGTDTIIKEVKRTGQIGSTITLASEDKADFSVTEGDVTTKYIFDSVDSENKTILEDGSTIVTLYFRTPAIWNYTVKNNVNDNLIASGTFTEGGDELVVPYSKYILAEDGTVWQRGVYSTTKGSKGYSEYRHYFTPDKENFEVTLEYSPSDIKNGILFSEAEDIEGLIRTETDQNSSRGSNGAGAYASDNKTVSVTTLKPGRYKVEIAVVGNSGTTILVKAGEATIINGETKGYWQPYTSKEEFTITENTILTVSGGTDKKSLDYILIYGTEAVNYTLKYVDGEKVIKEVTKSGIPGDPASVTEDDTNDFFDEDGNKYVCDSNVADVTIDKDGKTVVTISCTMAAQYEYTINNNANAETITGKVFEGESVTVPYSRIIIGTDGFVYEKEANADKKFEYTFTPDPENLVATIEYKKSDRKGIFFTEAEKLTAMTEVKDPTNSNAAGAYAEDAVQVYTLQPGQYRVSMGIKGEEGNVFTVKAGEKVILTATATGVWQVTPASNQFTINEETAITVEGAKSADNLLDYFLISGRIATANDLEYILRYKVGEEIIKEEHVPAEFGEVITLSEDDKANFYSEDGSIKYIYVEDDLNGQTVNADEAKTVITLIYRVAGNFKYNVKNNVNETVISGTCVEGENATVPFSKYILASDGKVYTKAAIDTKYSYSFPVNEDNLEVELEYAETDIANGLLLKEAESIDGTTEVKNAKYSNGAAAYAEAIQVGTLQRGNYKVTLGISGASGSEIKVLAGNDEVLMATTDGNAIEAVSKDFSVINSTPITIVGASATAPIDFILISGTEKDEATIVDVTFNGDTKLPENDIWGSEIQGMIKANGLYMTNNSSADNNYENRDFLTFESPVGNETDKLDVSYEVYSPKDKGQANTYYGINYFNEEGDFVFGIQEASGNWGYSANIVTANADGTTTTIALPKGHMSKEGGSVVNVSVRFSDGKAIIGIDGGNYLAYTNSEGIKSVKLSVTGENGYDRDMYVKSYTAKLSKTEAVKVADVKVKYVVDGQLINEISRAGVVGETLTITPADKASFYNEDKTDLYLYVSDDAADIIIKNDGTTVVTLTFKKANKYSYTVKNNVNADVKSGECIEGESVTVPYNRYILTTDGILWMKEATDKQYNHTFTPNEDNFEVTLEYKATEITNGIAFLEAEKIEGMTVTSGNNANVRCSNAEGAYAAEAVEVYTLKPGTYTVTIAGMGGDKDNDSKNISYIVKDGEDNTVLSARTNGSWFESTSEEFIVKEETILSFEGANASHPLDYILISGTEGIPVESITLDKANAEMTLGGDALQLTATVTPPYATEATVNWTSSNEAVATVDENGKVTAIKVGSANITAKAGDKSASCTVKVYPIAGDADWNGKISINDVVDITNFVVEKKTADEGWDEDEWKEFYAKGANANGDENGRITFADASEAAEIVANQKPSTSEQTRIKAAFDDSMDALVIGRVSSSSKGSVIPVTLDNTEAYVALQADIFLPEGMNVDVKEGSRIADSHTMLTKKHADNHIRVVIFNLGNKVFADNNAPILEIVTDSYVSASDIAISTVLASTSEANEYELAAKTADTNGVAAIGLDPEAPVKVFDVNGIYVGDTMEGLQQGTYIVRQGEVAKTVRVR